MKCVMQVAVWLILTFLQGIEIPTYFYPLSMRHPTPNRVSSRLPWLKRMDQAAIAALTLLAVASLGLYWAGQGGAQGRLIELDRQPRRSVRVYPEIIRRVFWGIKRLGLGIGSRGR